MSLNPNENEAQRAQQIALINQQAQQQAATPQRIPGQPADWSSNQAGYQLYLQQSQAAAQQRMAATLAANRAQQIPTATGGHGISVAQAQQLQAQALQSRYRTSQGFVQRNGTWYTPNGSVFQPTAPQTAYKYSSGAPIVQNKTEAPNIFGVTLPFIQSSVISGGKGLFVPSKIAPNVALQIQTMTPYNPTQVISNTTGSVATGVSAISNRVGTYFNAGFPVVVKGIDTFMPGVTDVFKVGYQQATLPKQYADITGELNTKGSSFESKWKPFVSDKGFTGSEQQYAQYTSEYNELKGLETKAKGIYAQIPSVRLEQMLTQRNEGGIQGNQKPFAWGAMEWTEGRVEDVSKKLGSVPYAGGALSGAFQGFAGSTIVLPTQVAVAGEMAWREVSSNPAQFPVMFGLHVAHGASVLGESLWTGLQTKPVETSAMLVGAYYGPHVVYGGAKFVNEASFIKVSRFDMPTSKVWDPELGEYKYSHSSFTGLVLDKAPWARIPGTQITIGKPYGGKSTIFGIRTGDAGFGFAVGKEAPGKLFGTNTRPVEAEYNLVDTKTITKPHNVPIALEAFRPISEPAAIESVEAVMSIRDIVSSRAFKATPRVAYGATGPQTMSREAFEKVKEYMNANAQDFNLYGSLVGKAYLGEGGRVSLADVDALINTKGKTAPREHAENIFKLMMETDYPNAKITRVEFKNNTGEMDYLLQGEIGGKPFIQMKVEKSVLTGTRYSGRYTADIGTMKKGQLALDLHPHRLGSGGEWIEIPGISARTMGYSSIVWGKGTMGYGKLVLPKEGKATIGFDRIKDVVDLSDFARDAASRLYEPVRPGRWSMERTRMAMSAERASETFTRDVYALDVEGEGANLMAESQNPLAFGEGRINKHGALAAYQASMERIARKGLGEEAVLFPNEKNGIPQGKAIVEPHELDFIRKAEDIKSREYIEVFNKKNLLLGSNIGSRGSVSYPENIPEKQLIGSTTIHSHPSYWALDQLGAVLRGITKPYEPLLISQKTTMSFSDADILGQYNTGEKIGMVYSIPKKTIQLFEYPKRGLSEANIEFAQDRSETYAAIKIVEEVNEAKLKYREEASKTNIIGAARLYLGFRTRTGPEIDARFFQNKLTEYARLTKSKYYQLSNIDMETGLADVEVFNEPDTAMYSIANSRFKPGELAYDISPYTVGSSAFVGATKASLFSYPAKVESNYRVPSGSKYSLSSDYSIKNVGGSVYAASQPSEYSQRGYTVSDYGGYKPSGYTPSNYVGYAPKGYAPSNYGGYKPSGYGLKPTGYSQKGYGQKAYGTIVTPRAYGSVVSSKPYGSALPVTTTYGLSTRTYQGEYTIPTQKALPPTRAVPKSPLWSPRSPVSPIIFPPTVPSFPWALNEQERKVKRRRRRGVLVSQWLIKNPVPRISTVYGPYKWRYNVDTPAFGRRFSGSKVIVQSFPGDTTWLKKRGI